MGLNLKNRLKKKKDFEYLFKKGKSQESKKEFLVLRYKENNLKNTRFGLIVSKKVFKRAVLRNKIKRQLRNILREDILPKIKKNIDAVIILYPGFQVKDYQELKEKIKGLFQKAKIINKK